MPSSPKPQSNHRLIPRWPLIVLAGLMLDASGPGASPAQVGALDSSGHLASHRGQRASRNLHGAKRYMDRNSISDAQNILEEDDDHRGEVRLA